MEGGGGEGTNPRGPGEGVTLSSGVVTCSLSLDDALEKRDKKWQNATSARMGSQVSGTLTTGPSQDLPPLLGRLFPPSGHCEPL